jgi:hypothetical protein
MDEPSGIRQSRRSKNSTHSRALRKQLLFGATPPSNYANVTGIGDSNSDHSVAKQAIEVAVLASTALNAYGTTNCLRIDGESDLNLGSPPESTLMVCEQWQRCTNHGCLSVSGTK